jgi:hypothetical protein
MTKKVTRLKLSYSADKGWIAEDVYYVGAYVPNYDRVVSLRELKTVFASFSGHLKIKAGDRVYPNKLRLAV